MYTRITIPNSFPISQACGSVSNRAKWDRQSITDTGKKKNCTKECTSKGRNRKRENRNGRRYRPPAEYTNKQTIKSIELERQFWKKLSPTIPPVISMAQTSQDHSFQQ
jgi:hypothetical protein